MTAIADIWTKRLATTDIYTEQAIAARAKAEREPLHQRRLQLLQSAERWEMMARQAEETRMRTQANAEERRLRPYHQHIAPKIG